MSTRATTGPTRKPLPSCARRAREDRAGTRTDAPMTSRTLQVVATDTHALRLVRRRHSHARTPARGVAQWAHPASRSTGTAVRVRAPYAIALSQLVHPHPHPHADAALCVAVWVSERQSSSFPYPTFRKRKPCRCRSLPCSGHHLRRSDEQAVMQLGARADAHELRSPGIVHDLRKCLPPTPSPQGAIVAAATLGSHFGLSTSGASSQRVDTSQAAIDTS